MLLVCCVYNNKAVCEWKYLAKLASRLTNIGKDCHTVCQCAEIQAYFLSTSCAVPSSVGVSLYADFVFNPFHSTQKQNNRKKNGNCNSFTENVSRILQAKDHTPNYTNK